MYRVWLPFLTVYILDIFTLIPKEDAKFKKKNFYKTLVLKIHIKDIDNTNHIHASVSHTSCPIIMEINVFFFLSFIVIYTTKGLGITQGKND